MLHDDEEQTQQHARDVEQLESSLRQCAAELRQLRVEAERRSVLIRDVTARWETLPTEASAAPESARASEMAVLVAERDAAVARALDAEVAAMEARFRVDELAGHLAAAPAKPVDSSAELAERDGTIRGFRARLAETEDARDRAEARLMLCEQDLGEASANADRLRREGLELNERLELEALRARTAAAELVAARGELLGIGHRAGEAETALHACSEELAVVRAMGDQLQKRVALALAERDAARGAIELGRADRDATAAEMAPLRDRAAILQAALVETRRGLQDFAGWLQSSDQGAALAGTTAFELDAPAGVSGLPPRDDETVPSIPRDWPAPAPGVQALQDELAERDSRLRILEARIEDLQRRSGLV